MGHKYVQLFQYPLKTAELSGKTETLQALMDDIDKGRIEDFKNGETITVRYKDENDTVTSSVIVINKDENGITLSSSISDNETKKIVDSTEEPKDEDALWLKDESGITPEIIEHDIKALNAAVLRLIELTNKHEYAFTTIMECGDLETNSTRKSLMEAAAPIKPDILEDGSGEIIDTEDNEEIPPDYPNYSEPNVRSICIKGAATEEIIKANVNSINERELILCESNYTLYTTLVINGIKRLIKISGSGGGGGGSETGSTEDIMSGITQNTEKDSIVSIRFEASSGKKYIVKVDDNGNLITYDENLDKKHPAPSSGTPGEYGTVLFEQKLYINSIYCGGTDAENNNVAINEHSLNYCSHNFVELSNLTNNDINLNGLSLQYSIGNTKWDVLPLRGVIKAGGTFLIRGAQCSVMDANTTLIKVDTYDMEWNVTEIIEGKEVSKPIQFSNKAAKFYLTYGEDACPVNTPYITDTDKKVKALYGYIDLVGLTNGTSTIDAAESGACTNLSSTRIMTKYYTMDPVKQATKALDARNNANDIQFIQLDADNIPNVNDYKPKASSENKDIFFNKTKLYEDKPTIVTCSLGIQATDNGNGATRCFNWVSKNNYSEGVWIYKNGSVVYSGLSIDNEPKLKDGNPNPRYYYNKIHQEATDGTFFTVHKAVVTGLSKGEYTYIVGRANSDGTPMTEHCCNTRRFVVKSDEDVKDGFKFVQTSDQQGFNWDEYQMWKYAARDIIKNEGVNFMVNTGDMTQNGNRINEWIDYFNAKDSYLEYEEMATIGNNDLCPTDVYQLGDGNDASKINPANILLYYTFELDEENLPVFDITVGDNVTESVYVPSLYSFNYGKVHFICINSEITDTAEKDVFKIKGADSTNYGFIYKEIKKWCEKDLELYQDNAEWTVAYCHENPFTIMTTDLKNSFFSNNTEDTSVYRGGSHLNTVATPENKYWFSKFCQNNGIRLVFGGHKHTQSTTWPLKENFTDAEQTDVVSMKPIIEVTSDDLYNYFNGATSLITISGKTQEDGHEFYLNGYSYPDTWFADGKLTGDYISDAHFCTFELVEHVTAPVYAMSQSSGYKHTSNKELPDYRIPWNRYFYPNAGAGKANAGQKYPIYTVWEITFGEGAKITGTVKKVAGLFNSSGKFNINTQGKNAKNNISNDTSWGESPVAINGITAGQDAIDKGKPESEWLKIEIIK